MSSTTPTTGSGASGSQDSDLTEKILKIIEITKEEMKDLDRTKKLLRKSIEDLDKEILRYSRTLELATMAMDFQHGTGQFKNPQGPSESSN